MRGALSLRFFFHFLCLFFGLFNWADIHKCLLRKVIPLSVSEFLEGSNRIFEARDLTRLPCEHLSNEKRLR